MSGSSAHNIPASTAITPGVVVSITHPSNAPGANQHPGIVRPAKICRSIPVISAIIHGIAISRIADLRYVRHANQYPGIAPSTTGHNIHAWSVIISGTAILVANPNNARRVSMPTGTRIPGCSSPMMMAQSGICM